MDTFMNRDKCVLRLVNEYEKHENLIVAVDFDDTIFDFHNMGTDHQMVIDLLKEGVRLNFHYIIFSAAPPDRYGAMMAFFEKEIGAYAPVNRNPHGMKYGQWGKIYYNILLDDRAGLAESYEILKEVISRINDTSNEL